MAGVDDLADRSGGVPGGAGIPRWYVWLVAAGLAVVAVALLVLWVDLRHTAAIERGQPLPPARILVTPSPTPAPGPYGGAP